MSKNIFSWLFSLGLLFSGFITNAQTDRKSIKSIQQEVFMLINQYRSGKGLPTLKEVAAIDVEAAEHSRRMATKKVSFGHDGFDGRSDRVMRKIRNLNASAENVAYSSTSAQSVVDMWLHSAGHKKNIEGDYNLTGIGIVADKNGVLYYTQMFFKQQP